MVPFARRVNQASAVMVLPSGATPDSTRRCAPTGVLAGSATVQANPPVGPMIPVYSTTGVECIVSVYSEPIFRPFAEIVDAASASWAPGVKSSTRSIADAGEDGAGEDGAGEGGRDVAGPAGGGDLELVGSRGRRCSGDRIGCRREGQAGRQLTVRDAVGDGAVSTGTDSVKAGRTWFVQLGGTPTAADATSPSKLR